MSREMREQIDRVKNWKQFLNEGKKIDLSKKYDNVIFSDDFYNQEENIVNYRTKHMENLNNIDKTSVIAEKELHISDVIQRFVENEKSRIQEKRLYYLKQKGDFSFHNLNSLQGQLGLLDRLEKELKNIV